MPSSNLLEEVALGVERSHTAVTRLLGALQAGDRDALDGLFTLLYDELKSLAHRQRRNWQGNHTLNTTALVSEAYLKLIGPVQLDVETRAHFFALAAKGMRHILCNYAREQKAEKRGGGRAKLPLDGSEIAEDEASFSEEEADTLLALEDALLQLDRIDPRLSEVVECRFFGGLTIEETAVVLAISPRTVKRDWAVAQAWLHRAMRSSG